MFENIKILRNELKLTQAEFANQLNISRANLAAIETGRVNLSDRVKKDICRVFGINPIWLDTRTGNMYQEITDKEKLQRILGKILAGENKLIAESLLTLSELDEQQLITVSTMINALKAKKEDVD